MKRIKNTILMVLFFILLFSYEFICQDVSHTKDDNPSSISTYIIILVGVLTLVFAALTFLAGVFPTRFRSAIPIKFGFLVNGIMQKSIRLSTGDPAKKIFFRYLNKSSSTLTDVDIDQKIKRPLALSGTSYAISYEIYKDSQGNVVNKVLHGDNPAENYYQIKHVDLLFSSKQVKDFSIELNTQGITPGKYEIEINCYSKSQNFKNKNMILEIEIN